ncbi:MAG: GTP diphosphokinase [Gammaproteobacteria bacterium]|nr:MAG: GTP diphosphokinase [Gammaproteobacteria bacterium]
MVKTTSLYPELADGRVDIDAWVVTLGHNRPQEHQEVIRLACQVAHQAHTGQSRASGDPYVAHVLSVAAILNELRLDHETIAAAILHDVVEDTALSIDDLSKLFGRSITALVDGVTKMELIHGFKELDDHQKERSHAENLRKMLLAMAEDVRVVLIKLADRLHNMRTLDHLPMHKQQRIAKETMDIFAPLANRLGIWQIKWELEDLSFRYLNPVAYRQIASSLSEKRLAREQYIENLVDELQKDLLGAGVKAEIYGRVKHIYGIWRKMKNKNQDFNQIYDVRAIRILVDDIPQCYAALGLVHTKWQYLAGEFDDYIATPKENNYRSIHTAVIGLDCRTVEIQIRTRDMHQQAELGVAAHWRYKEHRQPDDAFDRKISWLRQLLDWKDEVAEAGEFVDQFKSEVFADRVYAFTPMGNVVDLPLGSTSLDFAYQIHTEVGNLCRGAKVNGHIVPLTYQLCTGDKVEILTVKRGGPSRDWLNPYLGYLKTSKARQSVQHWFRVQDFDHNVSEGRIRLERELKRMGFTDVNYEKLAHRFDFDKTDNFFAAIGRGELKPLRVVNTFQSLIEPEQKVAPPVRPHKNVPAGPGHQVQVEGVGNLLTRMAQCCKPVPGDPIVGYITRGQGISIHRQDCHNVLHYVSECPERLVEVNWGNEDTGTYPVDVSIKAFDRQGLLHDITALLADEHINLIAASTASNKAENTVSIELRLEIPNISTLSRLLAKINQLPNVTEVIRKSS